MRPIDNSEKWLEIINSKSSLEMLTEKELECWNNISPENKSRYLKALIEKPTHAVSGIFTSIKDADITKRAESSASQGPHSGDYVERAHKLSAEISIAELLKIVNRTHHL